MKSPPHVGAEIQEMCLETVIHKDGFRQPSSVELFVVFSAALLDISV